MTDRNPIVELLWWVAVAGTVIGLGWICVELAGRRGSPPWVIAAVCVLVTLVVVAEFLKSREPGASFGSRAPVILLAVATAFGLVANIAGITDAKDKADIDTSVAGPAGRGLQKIVGIWGEDDCAVTFAFAVKDRALIVESARRPAGEPPFRLVATVLSAKGDVVDVRGEAPASARGRSSTFTYFTNGVSETLTWDDRSDGVPSEYRRCGA